jgi:hypothetical protein
MKTGPDVFVTAENEYGRQNMKTGPDALVKMLPHNQFVQSANNSAKPSDGQWVRHFRGGRIILARIFLVRVLFAKYVRGRENNGEEKERRESTNARTIKK